jgi:hypothetical protein
MSCLMLLSSGCFDFSSRPVLPDDSAENDFDDGQDFAEDAIDPGTGDDGPLPDGEDITADDGADPDEEEEIVCSCAGRVCGDDGCGNSCGTCDDPYYCSGEGRCVCVPDCETASCSSPDGCGGTCRCILDGSFVQPNLWYPDRAAFRAMMGEMRGLGMSVAILRAVRVVNCDGSSCSVSPIVADDMLGAVLDDIADAGMEAVVGLVDCKSAATDAPWWADSVLRDSCLNETRSLVGTVADRYASHRALAGFYLPPEIQAGTAVDSEHLGAANDFYSRAVAVVHERFSGYPVAAMVHFVATNNASTEALSPSELGDWVREFIMGGAVQASNLDIMILEDGVGEYKNALWASPDVSEYLAAAQADATPHAVYAALELYQWSPAKTSSPSDNYMHPASLSRIRRQIDQAAGARRRIANQYPIHMAGNVTFVSFGAESAGLHRAYDALYFRSTYVESAFYSFSSPTSGGYPDITGSMLFDDRTGEEPRDADWVGWILSSGSTLTITVNLGVRRTITDVAVVLRSQTGTNNYYPSRMSVYVSPDGTDADYVPMGSFDVPYDSDETYGNMTARVSSPAGVEAMGVKIELFLLSQWLMASEIEIN